MTSIKYIYSRVKLCSASESTVCKMRTSVVVLLTILLSAVFTAEGVAKDDECQRKFIHKQMQQVLFKMCFIIPYVTVV